MAKKCRYFTCVRAASAKQDTCAACRQRHKYWDDKTPAERLERRRKLELSGETMSEFVPDVRLREFVKKEHKRELRENAQG